MALRLGAGNCGVDHGAGEERRRVAPRHHEEHLAVLRTLRLVDGERVGELPVLHLVLRDEHGGLAVGVGEVELHPHCARRVEGAAGAGRAVPDVEVGGVLGADDTVSWVDPARAWVDELLDVSVERAHGAGLVGRLAVAAAEDDVLPEVHIAAANRVEYRRMRLACVGHGAELVKLVVALGVRGRNLSGANGEGRRKHRLP